MQLHPRKPRLGRSDLCTTLYTAVRRSARIQNTPKRTSHNRSVQPLEITITESSESDQEEEPPRLEENMEGQAIPGEKTQEEKLEYAVQLLETMGTQGDNRGSNFSEPRYKNMYFESQKQNVALKKENRKLSTKLEISLAKLEGFEKGSNASLECMSKFKDVVTSLSNASPMAFPKAASSSKRRKLPKGKREDNRLCSRYVKNEPCPCPFWGMLLCSYFDGLL